MAIGPGKLYLLLLDMLPSLRQQKDALHCHMLHSKAVASSFEVQARMCVWLWCGCDYNIDASRRGCGRDNKQLHFTDDDKLMITTKH